MARLARKLKRGEQVDIPSAPGVRVRRERGCVVILVDTERANEKDVEGLFPCRDPDASKESGLAE